MKMLPEIRVIALQHFVFFVANNLYKPVIAKPQKFHNIENLLLNIINDNTWQAYFKYIAKSAYFFKIINQ